MISIKNLDTYNLNSNSSLYLNKISFRIYNKDNNNKHNPLL